MTKTMRTALLTLEQRGTVASTSGAYDDLVKLGYAKSLGLIPASSSPRCSTLKAGYKITQKGRERAKKIVEAQQSFTEDDVFRCPGHEG